ncbi:MAG: protein kinase [Nannocystis sp.]|uniref:nSTAND1 domain-containing NTPase n=1 Tax=Nannocystis sp. TaxID=1962667 RepID=UPI002420FA0A|nr:protein kinase [Nannocystis sp.]MBK9757333.1 protein kinase [Nannocystis sp.]
MTPEHAPSDTWAPPQEFDEYRIVRLLGQGTMGRVYLAHDTVLDRAVAVKFINRVADAEDRERFIVEARAVARLQHPNVVTLHRVGELAGYPYLITEYIRGKSLSELVLPVSWRRVQELGVGLARGLAAAHRHGVLHRDIKLANALLTETGEVKLLDFSLAKLLDVTHADSSQPRPQPAPAAAVDAAISAVERYTAEQARRSGSHPAASDSDVMSALTSSQRMQGATISGSWGASSDTLSAPPTGTIAPGGERPSELTQVGTLLGTPNYMAPELWRAEGATRRSDVYALGVLLYILACGGPPTEATSTVELATKIQEREPRPLLEKAARCDARLAAIIDRCIRRDPFERYASGEELLAALESLSPTSRDQAIPDGNPYRGLRAFESQHRALFFGRSFEIRAVLERLRADALVVVAGDSGVGKSSLCKAGVAPLVEEGQLDLNRQWTSISITPGRYPLPTLVDALARLLDLAEDTVHELVKAGADELVRAFRKQLGEARGRLLMIDQFEELTTLADPAEVAVVGPLLAHLASGLPGLRVLATVRGDFLTRVAQLPGVGDELTRAIYILRPLTPEGAREAIVGPARVKGVSFESEELVQELIQAGSHGSLPLLQFALAELWEIRDPATNMISAAELKKIGGVSGALARHGDAALAELIPEQRVAARRVLMRLVSVDDTRAVRTEEELVAGSAAAGAALKALVRSRLVVAREVADQAVYEIAHEALLGGWATLSSWLEEERESRAVRHRLELAVLDWERLGRGRDGLLSGAPLQEVLALEVATLRPREHEFIAACRGAAARSRLLRRVAAVAVPLVALLTYGGIWFKGQLDLRARIDAHAAVASEENATAEAISVEAEALRSQAIAAFDAGESAKGEAVWGRYVAAVPGIERGLARAAQQLEIALSLDIRRDDVRAQLLDVLWKRAIRAEEAGRDELAMEDHLERIKLYDQSGERMAQWETPGALSVTSEPPGARVTLERYVADGGHWRADSVGTLGSTPLPIQTLARGSYRLRLEMPGKVTVGYPVTIGRGESLAVTVALPPTDSVPDGFIYVPAGRFVYGSREIESIRGFLRAEPAHTVTTGPYLIARHEVTYAQYIEYLAAQSPEQRAALLKAAAASPAQLQERPEGGWRLILTVGAQVYTLDSGSPLSYEGRKQRARVAWERLPVSGIDGAEARAYLAWLDRSGRVPGARYCNEHEWERAARGADERLFASGDVLYPTDANIDDTYGKVANAFGPDPVGSYPHVVSPFGLFDTDGNVYEPAVSSHREDVLMVRGGAYFYSAIQARTTARFEVPASLRDTTLGLRVCATWPPPVATK